MDLQRVLKKLAREPGYAFGRFHTVRQGYASLQNIASSGWPVPRKPTPRGSVFGLDARQALQALESEGLAPGMSLAPEVVQEVRAFAERSTLISSDFERFTLSDLRDGKLGDKTIAMAYCVAPTDCPAVRAISSNQVLRDICRAYLGYTPRSEEVRLYWSFATKLDEAERRRQNQTIDFHFDVHHYSFCYVHFYLTDTDADSGAHVAVKGSHRRKPLRWLFGSARRSDAEVHSEYGSDSVMRLDGAPGYGFIEDTSCYHKALAPVRADRLLLQFRWF
jgi:hypothetical protein